MKQAHTSMVVTVLGTLMVSIAACSDSDEEIGGGPGDETGGPDAAMLASSSSSSGNDANGSSSSGAGPSGSSSSSSGLASSSGGDAGTSSSGGDAGTSSSSGDAGTSSSSGGSSGGGWPTDGCLAVETGAWSFVTYGGQTSPYTVEASFTPAPGNPRWHAIVFSIYSGSQRLGQDYPLALRPQTVWAYAGNDGAVKDFVAESGTARVDSYGVGPRVSGTLTNVVLRETALDSQGSPAFVPGGLCITLASAAIATNP